MLNVVIRKVESLEYGTMPTKILYVPTINDNPNDFGNLFKLFNEALDYNGKIILDFSQCEFIRPNAIAVIGCMARVIQSRGREIFIATDTVENKVLAFLRKSGLASVFNLPLETHNSNTIPYREDINLDQDGIIDFLSNNWLREKWVSVSEKLLSEIMGNMWEIYSNAFEHSGTDYGVFTCGQYYRNNHVVLTVVDFGKGIVENVRDFFISNGIQKIKVREIPDKKCLEWAFQKGNSTIANKNIPRGMGLDLLKNFISSNHGRLELYSNNAHVVISANGEYYEDCEHGFSGTVVHITLICDEKFYRLQSEVSSF